MEMAAVPVWWMSPLIISLPALMSLMTSVLGFQGPVTRVSGSTLHTLLPRASRITDSIVLLPVRLRPWMQTVCEICLGFTRQLPTCHMRARVSPCMTLEMLGMPERFVESIPMRHGRIYR